MEQQFKTDSEIYAVLEREIIDLTLRPGCSLSENPLCTRFGAPRSLIRVVLQRLQENGLVKIVPYKGTTVTRLNRDIVDELIYERIAVEARVLRDFAPHCTPEHRALIRQRAAAYDELAKAETLDFNRLYEADTRLHETWFSAMGKMYLWRTLQNAHADYSRFRMLDTMTSMITIKRFRRCTRLCLLLFISAIRLLTIFLYATPIITQPLCFRKGILSKFYVYNNASL